jgi:hypothetical protein
MERETECCVCGAGVRTDDPAVPDEYFAPAWCHRACVNSPGGIAWREKQKATDPGYARYLRLSTVGRSVACPACAGSCRVSAKARGMAAGSWEACCTACSAVTALNGYLHHEEYDRLAAAEREFLLDASSDGWRARVETIASEADRKLDAQRCACSSHFSLAAAPRCPRCRAVVMDSYFHYAHT